MRLSGIRVRTWMLVVLAIALSVGGPMEFVRLRRLSAYYRFTAEGCMENVRTHASTELNLRRRLIAKNYGAEGPELLGVQHELACFQAASEANRAAIFEHAASHPWESVPERPAMGSTRLDATPQIRRILSQPGSQALTMPDPGPNFQFPGETMHPRNTTPTPVDPNADPRTTAAPPP